MNLMKRATIVLLVAAIAGCNSSNPKPMQTSQDTNTGSASSTTTQAQPTPAQPPASDPRAQSASAAALPTCEQCREAQCSFESTTEVCVSCRTEIYSCEGGTYYWRDMNGIDYDQSVATRIGRTYRPASRGGSWAGSYQTPYFQQMRPYLHSSFCVDRTVTCMQSRQYMQRRLNCSKAISGMDQALYSVGQGQRSEDVVYQLRRDVRPMIDQASSESPSIGRRLGSLAEQVTENLGYAVGSGIRGIGDRIIERGTIAVTHPVRKIMGALSHATDYYSSARMRGIPADSVCDQQYQDQLGWHELCTEQTVEQICIEQTTQVRVYCN
jgi:hypothetical protein